MAACNLTDAEVAALYEEALADPGPAEAMEAEAQAAADAATCPLCGM